MIGNTQRAAASGSKIVLWSESAIATLNSANATELHRQLGLIASTYETYIGATYLQWVNDNKTDRQGKFSSRPYLTFSDKVWNTFVLINDDGAVNLTYHKAHPVPGIEANVEAGPSELLWTDTKYGRMGVAICFDLNYPTFIGQAGKNDIDILLQVTFGLKLS
jgi:predicted amidohydrolase